MKISELIDDKYLKTTDFENVFDVYEREDGDYEFNLNESLYIGIPPEMILTDICSNLMFWPVASYKLYNTPRLAWLLMKLNDVSPDDMFKPLLPGDKIKYVGGEIAEQIVRKINQYGNS